MDRVNIKMKKKILFLLFSSFIVIIILIIRTGYLQFIKGEELQLKAYSQQTQDRKINPKRGTIYDSTKENILATSATVYTITANPIKIESSMKEKVAMKLSEIFELEYESVLQKLKKKVAVVTIVSKCDKEKTDILREYLKEENIKSGINIDEDTKRYYPYGSLASHVIGFCGSDNQGLDGIEAKFESLLKGTSGKVQNMIDARGNDILAEENYIEAIDGNDLVLSIDVNIQSIAEKYLKEACIDNVCTDGGNVVIMNPKTGDILAMATYPSYNLNTPYELNIEDTENISKSERTKLLQAIWRNKAIADAYEPGSVFKLITASASLEEGITTTDKKGEFSCIGYIEVAGVRIKCWRYYRPHGAESLREALMNSCNPVFIGLRTKIRKRNIL